MTRPATAPVVIATQPTTDPARVETTASSQPSTAPSANGESTNRLIHEKSPYLLQHAHNPVDWYPWGAEAFAAAKKSDKPIFLSVGYATCHWCHVMERESFTDPVIAKLMNQWFICVKVDREERPDVDRTYMAFVVAATGSGGWPMTVILTPDGKPFLGGTYFPPADSEGRPSLKTLLEKVHDAWQNQRERVLTSAARSQQALRADAMVDPEKDAPAADDALLGPAYDALNKEFDAAHGGFGAAPKFPQPVVLNFLSALYARTGRDRERDMVLQTLRAMARGGIHDAIGGGFHRYSTDAIWFLPHFEKMLYDQAQIGDALLDASLLSQSQLLTDTARDTFDYVLRDLTGPDGQFYSAEDADSAANRDQPAKKTEGAFYLWRSTDIDDLLTKSEADVLDFCYGVQRHGNIEHDRSRDFAGLNLLALVRSPPEASKEFDRPVEQINRLLISARKKLLAARAQRPRPALDDDAIVAWNGLMIHALARAGPILGDDRYTAAATRAATFLFEHCYDPKTHTLARHERDGQAGGAGFATDYACLISGLTELYQSTLEPRWLAWALQLQATMDERFWDGAGDGYFETVGDPSDAALVRTKEDQDNAEPSANSVAAANLLRLGQMTDRKEFRDKADRILNLFAPRIRRAPLSMCALLTAVMQKTGDATEVIIAGNPAADDTRAIVRETYAHFQPGRTLVCADGGEGQRLLAGGLEFLKDVKPLNGKATAYVCRNKTCQAPTQDLGALALLLDNRQLPHPTTAPTTGATGPATAPSAHPKTTATTRPANAPATTRPTRKRG